MPGGNNIQTFPDLDALAQHLRAQDKKVILLFAYNGTGKTRLSMAFKELGKQTPEEGETIRDTLYFNAFTEDLFTWDNDLENDRERVLRMNTDSRFFAGLAELEMESRIRPILQRYSGFEFSINYEEGLIGFFRDKRVKQSDGSYETVRYDNIKISRGEENTFIWCFSRNFSIIRTCNVGIACKFYPSFCSIEKLNYSCPMSCQSLLNRFSSECFIHSIMFFICQRGCHAIRCIQS